MIVRVPYSVDTFKHTTVYVLACLLDINKELT